MSDDLPPAEPTEITVEQAADKLEALNNPAPVQEAAPQEASTQAPDPTPEPEIEPEIEVDGKKLKQSELIEAYRKASAPTPPAPQTDPALQESARLAAAAAAYEQQLQALIAAQTPDFEKLMRENPQEYLIAKHQHEQRQAALYQAQVHRQQAETQQRQQFETELQRTLQAESEKLAAAVPEWKDEAVAQSERSDLAAYLKNLGYTSETLNAISDHREVLIARKAMLYDKMIAEQKQSVDKLQEKLTKLPPPRVEKPGRGDTTRSPVDEAKARLRKTGSLDAAAAAFAAFGI